MDQHPSDKRNTGDSKANQDRGERDHPFDYCPDHVSICPLINRPSVRLTDASPQEIEAQHSLLISGIMV